MFQSVAVPVFISILSLELISPSLLAQEVPIRRIYAIDHDGKNLRTIKEFHGYDNIGSLSLSHRGDRIAFDAKKAGAQYPNLMILDLVEDQLFELGHGAMPTWSEDENSLAYSSYSPQRGVFERLIEEDFKVCLDPNGWGIRFSPDGKFHAYTCGAEFVITNIETGEVRSIVPKRQEPYRHIYWNFSWASDCSRIVFRASKHDGGYEVAIVDFSQDQPTTTVCFDAELYSNNLGWRPDSDQIMISNKGLPDKPAQLHLFKAKANASPVLFMGQETHVWNTAGAWSSDGKSHYYSAKDKSVLSKSQ